MKLRQIRVDGYKNLIDCVVNLGDFNVLVGPNNSGKSNLLETLQMLGGICFGTNELREKIFGGLTPPSRLSTWICHLNEYRNKPLTIGVAFDTTWKKRHWYIDYEVTIESAGPGKKQPRFVRETLKAKPFSKTGPVTTYISRNGKKLKIRGKRERSIALNNSSLVAINSIYPEFEGLSPEFELFFDGIYRIGMMKIFAFSPEGLRGAIYTELDIEGMYISSFDLCLVADAIKERKKHYKLFKESICDILDLVEVRFEAEDRPVPTPKPEDETKETLKRLRFFAIRRCKDDRYSLIEEYSDGTLVVVAILAALFSEKARGPILCMEELENYLHPSAVEKLLRFLQTHADKWPIILTTHSSYLINHVNPEDVNVAVVDDTGAAHCEKVRNTKQLRDYLKSGFMSFGDMLASNFEDVLGK